MTIEKRFDIPFISSLALREKQIQQNYRPIIAVHKWFARRPGTLFRGLLLAEYCDAPLQESFYQSTQLENLRIADPFMGGGTPLIEANRLGCHVHGYDINPMSWWIVNRELEHLDLESYSRVSAEVFRSLSSEIGDLYRTDCRICGSSEAWVKYFIWIKTTSCTDCGHSFDLFPGYLLAQNRRHPRNIIICASCGELNETDSRTDPGNCNSCLVPLSVSGPARRCRCACPHCGKVNTYATSENGPPSHRMIALEYHCTACKRKHKGRFFKTPQTEDLRRYAEAEARLAKLRLKYIPEDEIPAGDESNRLHRWGYRTYRELFNSRQLLGLELLARFIADEPDQRIRNALATNLSDLLRYQNMLCRYDTMALKSLDIFSVHGFPVGLVACESNLLGIAGGSSNNIGSGGWLNIVEKFRKAKSYCEVPFEIRRIGKKKVKVEVPGEWIGDMRGDGLKREIHLNCCSATEVDLAPGSLDGVFTDPPYLGNVQYAELMDFCYVWLRKLIPSSSFQSPTTRSSNELTANQTMGRDTVHFTEGIATVFVRMVRALKPGKPFAFTYHHNSLDAYYPLAVAILDAGLVCSASLPCPAEMGASIHINGTGSSIVDTVFVCRSTGTVSRKTLAETAAEFAELLFLDIENLKAGGRQPTAGDIRCLVFGHIIRMAIWNLKNEWDSSLPTSQKLMRLSKHMKLLPQRKEIEAVITANTSSKLFMVSDIGGLYETADVRF